MYPSNFFNQECYLWNKGSISNDSYWLGQPRESQFIYTWGWWNDRCNIQSKGAWSWSSNWECLSGKLSTLQGKGEGGIWHGRQQSGCTYISGIWWGMAEAHKGTRFDNRIWERDWRVHWKSLWLWHQIYTLPQMWEWWWIKCRVA